MLRIEYSKLENLFDELMLKEFQPLILLPDYIRCDMRTVLESKITLTLRNARKRIWKHYTNKDQDWERLFHELEDYDFPAQEYLGMRDELFYELSYFSLGEMVILTAVEKILKSREFIKGYEDLYIDTKKHTNRRLI